MKTLLWLREDLRLFDNPALHFAASQGEVLPVFILPEGLGAASRWWLHHSLRSLQQSFSQKGVELVLRRGPPEKVLAQMQAETNADAVVWNRVYTPAGIDSGKRVKDVLVGCATRSFNAQLLTEPTQVFTQQATPFKVFTPFWRKCLSQLEPSPVLEVPSLTPVLSPPSSEQLDDWGLLPRKPNWSAGLGERWQAGEAGAQTRWRKFLEGSISRYKEGRDIPSEENTSMLSPHLAFGEISPKQIWFDTHEAIASRAVDSDNGYKVLSQIGWREFSRYLLVHFPHLVREPFNARFEQFPWHSDAKLLAAWQRGQTGYPIVDAGMRELWHTGYMHNRVRMVVASFLTKHCLTHWQAGRDWFWDTLVDADLGNNTMGWQWAAGCGADAAPYFRIFNPILQGEKFDKQGVYIKKWVPELAKLESRYINKPWEADPITLQQAEVTLGKNYPFPIVDHKQARHQALAAYQVIRT